MEKRFIKKETCKKVHFSCGSNGLHGVRGGDFYPYDKHHKTVTTMPREYCDLNRRKLDIRRMR